MHKGGRDVIAVAACCRRGSWDPASAVPRPPDFFVSFFVFLLLVREKIRRGFGEFSARIRASDVFICPDKEMYLVDNPEIRSAAVCTRLHTPYTHSQSFC
ncbi:hypothetical protein MTP99_016748 [Tenebrio molitor]|jgi:hypothetical protein|nr:hypothetical protein MTP99_016748 [Tenebrio molitor]